MTRKRIIYPIGWQSFEQIRKNGAIYVDKTGYIDQLVHESRFVFLSRPRRFGKSLLLSSIEAYFKGKKELFEGLEISHTEEQWEEFPVIRFDLSKTECTDPAKLENYLINQLDYYEKNYDVDSGEKILSTGERFGQLIEKIYRKSTREVVVLVDEYDKGIVEAVHDKEALKKNQELLRPFFSQLKAYDDYIKFVFITGVARFRHYTLFSGLNNLEDISFNEDYAAICGVTMEELKKYFSEGLENMAEAYNTNVVDITSRIVQKYNGYKFTPANIHVINPFSLLNSLKDKSLSEYWLLTGTSKVFVEYLSQSNYDLSKLDNIWASKKRLSGLYDSNDPIPLLYQTGYLTLTKYDRDLDSFYLQIPNGEVRGALLEDLAQCF